MKKKCICASVCAPVCPVCSKSQQKKNEKNEKNEMNEKNEKNEMNEMVEKHHGISMASLGYRLRLHGQKVQISEMSLTLHRRSTQDSHGQLVQNRALWDFCMGASFQTS
jgi:hypothetical protein